jgi:HSP20 family protein
MIPTLWTRTGVFPVAERLYDNRREMDRLFEEGGAAMQNGGGQWVPAMDVVETDEAILCNLEVPGLTREDLDIHVEGNLIRISGEKRFEQQHDQNETGYRHVERRYGRFERSFTIPRTVEGERVTARYQDGVLTIELPKAEQLKPRKVSIESGATSRQIEK